MASRPASIDKSHIEWYNLADTRKSAIPGAHRWCVHSRLGQRRRLRDRCRRQRQEGNRQDDHRRQPGTALVCGPGRFSWDARGADWALLVVEPTVSGEHDLECILATTDHFNVAAMVVISKADLNAARADGIAAYCAARGVEVVGRIPYDTVVTEAMVAGQPVTAVDQGTVVQAVHGIWQRVKEALQ